MALSRLVYAAAGAVVIYLLADTGAARVRLALYPVAHAHAACLAHRPILTRLCVLHR